MRLSRGRLGPVILTLLVSGSVVAPTAASANAQSSARYVSGGTAVARNAGQPVLDEGGVVCDTGEGVGAGGFCLPFGAGGAVSVLDDAAGEEVAYQVCVDNDGDGACRSPDPGPTCRDVVAFSHDDSGAFYNPVGPLPTGFAKGCEGGPWRGYVVFLCEGVHVAGHDAGHPHPVTEGTGRLTSGGEGLGTFCGGSTAQPSAKRYVVEAGRYVGGGTAVLRDGDQPTVDEGSVICDTGHGAGSGGLCLPFGAGDAVTIADDALGQDVAYQVCVDNNGDGFCTSPDFDPACPDQVFFSHDDAGNFFNPVGPLPTGFAPGCQGGAWPGYVVFLCEGVHVVGGAGHAHPAIAGFGRVTTGGEGLGTFCGGSPVRQSRKRYVVGGVGDPGLPCTLAGSEDRTGQVLNPSTKAGVLQGGPVLASGVDATAAPMATVQITCEVRVNGSTVTSSVSAGVAVASLTEVVMFAAPEGSVAEVCTDVTVDGRAYTYDAVTGRFTTGPAACLPIDDNPAEPAQDAAFPTAEQVLVDVADPLACPVFEGALAALRPVWELFWVCPPYPAERLAREGVGTATAVRDPIG